MAAFARIVAEIKCLRVFTCHRCGATANGTTERFSLEGHTPEAVAAQLAATPMRAAAMPVGWASYYAPRADVYRCPKCNEGD